MYVGFRSEPVILFDARQLRIWPAAISGAMVLRMDPDDADDDAAATGGMFFDQGEALPSQTAGDAPTEANEPASPRLRLHRREQGQFRTIVPDLLLPA